MPISSHFRSWKALLAMHDRLAISKFCLHVFICGRLFKLRQPERKAYGQTAIMACLERFSVNMVHCLWTVRSGNSVNEDTTAVFNIDNQSERELRQYLSSIANQCIAKCAADDDDDGGTAGDQLPSAIILDGLHRITTTPLGDIFSALLNVELCDRSVLHWPQCHCLRRSVTVTL